MRAISPWRKTGRWRLHPHWLFGLVAQVEETRLAGHSLHDYDEWLEHQYRWRKAKPHDLERRPRYD